VTLDILTAEPKQYRTQEMFKIRREEITLMEMDETEE
jgi:hypothetical protein